MPGEHPPTPPPSRWPALIILPTLPKFQLVWRRLCDVLFPSFLVKYSLTDAPLLIEYRFQVTRVAPSTLRLRSRGRPSLPPPRLASSLLHSVVRSASLPPYFPVSIPPPCLASSLLPILPPVNLPYPLRPGGSGRVAKHAAGMSFHLILSIRCPLVWYTMCQPQPRKSSYPESPEKLFSVDFKYMRRQ